jgi:GMP synthase (glutamine-hydrolysing)
MKRVLLVRAGSCDPAVRARHGDFVDWFLALLRVADVTVADATLGPAALPPVRAFGGVVVTGSYDSATRPEPWMDALGGYMVEAARDVPVLAVCFGHQLLGRALGGAVVRNPRGPEAGTCEVTLTAAGRSDPVFQGLPARLPVQQFHEDHVPALPPGAVLLATNAHAPVQAFAAGRARAVQFHPELDAPRTRALLEAHRDWAFPGRPDAAAAALAAVRETPAARVLSSWLDREVRDTPAASRRPGTAGDARGAAVPPDGA